MKKRIRVIVIVACMALLILGYYYYISNVRNKTIKEETAPPVSTVSNLLLKNFDRDYPPTPKEVIKAYADITVAFYMEQYDDSEFDALADKILELYDDELASNTEHSAYLRNLKDEVTNFKNNGTYVSSYSTSSSTDVDYFDQDGYQWARLYLTFTLKQGKNISLTKETFILRKDDSGHWKIYGWALTPTEE